MAQGHISTADLQAFSQLRATIFDGIRRALAIDGHHKSYEGALDLRLPNYFRERIDDDGYALELHCYVLGPSRQYEWRGRTLGDVVAKAREDVDVWLADLAEQEKEA